MRNRELSIETLLPRISSNYIDVLTGQKQNGGPADHLFGDVGINNLVGCELLP